MPISEHGKEVNYCREQSDPVLAKLIAHQKRLEIQIHESQQQIAHDLALMKELPFIYGFAPVPKK